MPYIIQTGLDGQDTRYHSRRAVATLDEARDEVSRIVAASHPNVPNGLGAIAGPGSIGPLPDGTVIEVERAAAVDAAGFVADFNATHAAA